MSQVMPEYTRIFAGIFAGIRKKIDFYFSYTRKREGETL